MGSRYCTGQTTTHERNRFVLEHVLQTIENARLISRIGMYMTGNSLQVFSIMMVFMLFKTPITQVLAIQATFSRFESEGTKQKMLLVKIVYILCNALSLALGIYKVNQMGLLPYVSLLEFDMAMLIRHQQYDAIRLAGLGDGKRATGTSVPCIFHLNDTQREQTYQRYLFSQIRCSECGELWLLITKCFCLLVFHTMPACDRSSCDLTPLLVLS